jgi:ribose-phosphate pyrophosphokinase
VLTVDLHADQIMGFFDIAVDNVYASPVLLGDVWKQKYDKMVVVSPDVGGVVRARALAKRLDDADLVIIDKRRSKANKSEVMNIIGDVREKTCVIIDDMVDTAGTCARRRCPESARCEEGRRLHHAPGSVRPGCVKNQRVGTRRNRRDRYDSAQ